MSAERARGASPGRPPLLSPAEAASYWEARHRTETPSRSGGHLGLDDAGNEIFYARRLGMLLDIVGEMANPVAPLLVLDAGCGRGYFAHALARSGHRVDGIDISPTAIRRCREREVPPGRPSPRFSVSGLPDWRVPYLYDVVYAIDVLFHLTSDAEWQRGLVNLASLVRLAGTLVVTDEGGPGSAGHRVRRGDYTVHRGYDDYRRVLEPRGLRLREFRPYGFRENTVGFYVYTRIS